MALSETPEQFVQRWVSASVQEFADYEVPYAIAIEIAWRVLMQALSISAGNDLNKAAHDMLVQSHSVAAQLRKGYLNTGNSFGTLH
jgi:hypothetical protein